MAATIGRIALTSRSFLVPKILASTASIMKGSRYRRVFRISILPCQGRRRRGEELSFGSKRANPAPRLHRSRITSMPASMSSPSVWATCRHVGSAVLCRSPQFAKGLQSSLWADPEAGQHLARYGDDTSAMMIVQKVSERLLANQKRGVAAVKLARGLRQGQTDFRDSCQARRFRGGSRHHLASSCGLP